MINDDNKSTLPGGISEPQSTDDTGRRLPEELQNTEAYDKNALQGMSQVKAADAEGIATEKDITPHNTHVNPTDSEQEPYTVNKQDSAGNDSPGSDNLNTASAAVTQDDHLGEQSISGTTPDPTADDDTLAAAQAVGTQMDEDTEHPKELDIAGDIDKAEQDLRTK